MLFFVQTRMFWRALEGYTSWDCGTTRVNQDYPRKTVMYPDCQTTACVTSFRPEFRKIDIITRPVLKGVG